MLRQFSIQLYSSLDKGDGGYRTEVLVKKLTDEQNSFYTAGREGEFIHYIEFSSDLVICI